jgi:crossover junction endodeoxyribonuclease RusA
VTLDLPFPVSVNHYWQSCVRGRRVHRFISDKGRDFRAEVITLAMVARVKRMEGPLRSIVTLYPPDNHKRDLDNFAGKSLYDALAHAGVYSDDSQVREQHHAWGPVVAGGRCTVEITPI